MRKISKGLAIAARRGDRRRQSGGGRPAGSGQGYGPQGYGPMGFMHGRGGPGMMGGWGGRPSPVSPIPPRGWTR